MFDLQCSFKLRINYIGNLISKLLNLCLFKDYYNQKKKKKKKITKYNIKN